LADGNFYALYGNGYGSPNGCPTLYLVRLNDGFVRKIKVNPAGGTVNASTVCSPSNGLGRPSLFDTAVLSGGAGDRITDYVYAGDLKGNVWRFDLRSLGAPSGSPPQLLSSSLGLRLFNGVISGDGQPITGGIEIGKGPDLFSSCGNTNNPVSTAMLYFGTGSFFQDGDTRPTPETQSFYGIIDDFSSPNNPITRSNLRQRFINDLWQQL
jgi:type IV pilus assembly protein PilY1